ncbi:DUF6381 family protein [Streptomyces sp. NBC_00344]|uniref:DUF6381 family protein n=1 Tax=Streptomyces sp. NBC_00344 TaxID=2975720 RepID=UPI002E221BA3
MDVSGEFGSRIKQMRAKAVDLKQEAERTTDPDERRRLNEKARKLQDLSEQESGMASGDIYPLE